MAADSDTQNRSLARQRFGILRQIEDALEKPMIFLGFAWLVLLVVDLTRGLSPFFQHLNTAIWIIFILEFLLRFTIAPGKLRYLRSNWLTLIALAIPVLRLFRILRAVRLLRLARASRGLRLVRLVTSVNRGMRALGATLKHNKFSYALALTVIIVLSGAAGMHALESPGSPKDQFGSYSSSVWWTAMMMTTMGADFFPETPEGRFLCLMLAMYAFAIWGYFTATIATFFLGRSDPSRIPQSPDLEALRAELAKLRVELRLHKPFGPEHRSEPATHDS